MSCGRGLGWKLFRGLKKETRGNKIGSCRSRIRNLCKAFSDKIYRCIYTHIYSIRNRRALFDERSSTVSFQTVWVRRPCNSYVLQDGITGTPWLLVVLILVRGLQFYSVSIRYAWNACDKNGRTHETVIYLLLFFSSSNLTNDFLVVVLFNNSFFLFLHLQFSFGFSSSI